MGKPTGYYIMQYSVYKCLFAVPGSFWPHPIQARVHRAIMKPGFLLQSPRRARSSQSVVLYVFSHLKTTTREGDKHTTTATLYCRWQDGKTLRSLD